MEHRQVVGITVGTAVFTAGTGALVAALVVAITTPSEEAARWFGPLLYGGIACLVVGAYLLLAAWFGLWLPSPRERFIGRALWDRMYFSKASSLRRDRLAMRAAEDQLRTRIQREVEAAGLTAFRAAQTVYEEIVDPPGWAPQFWVIPDGGGHMLGCRTSGNITPVECSTLNDDEAQARIEQFNAIVTGAQQWSELHEWRCVHARLQAKQT